MFLQLLNLGKKESRRLKIKRADQVEQQVQKVLESSDQKIILMVRG